MKTVDAQNKLCPFMFANPAARSSPYSTCMTASCMAWEAERHTTAPYALTGEGYCALIQNTDFAVRWVHDE